MGSIDLFYYFIYFLNIIYQSYKILLWLFDNLFDDDSLGGLIQT